MANNSIYFRMRGGKRKVSISEAALQREWTELKKRSHTNEGPPDVSLETESFDDIYAWGKWIARKGNITPEKSRQLLKEVREHLRSE